VERLRLKDALMYFFKSTGWLAKLITLLGLIFVPIIGWLAILGYFLRIAEKWVSGEYETLPDFSNFGSMIMAGLILFVVMIVYSVPQMVLAFIPCLGNLLSTAYNIILILIAPYLISVVAVDKSISPDVFNFNRIIQFVSDNIVNLLIILAVDIVVGIVSVILLAPFVVGGVVFLINAENNNTLYIPAIASFAIACVILFLVSIWSSSVIYSLSGNVYGIWLGRRNPS